MVNCAAINCTARSDSKSGEKVHFHKFPRDPKFRKIWEIKLKRKGLVVTKDSRVCHKHFEPECYEKDPRIMLSIGFEPKSWQLKPDAVPTIFNFGNPPASNLESEPVNRKRKRNSSAFEKRRKLEVLGEIMPSNMELGSPDEVENTDTIDAIDLNIISMMPHTPKTADKCVGTDTEMFSVGTQTSSNVVTRRHVQCEAKITIPVVSKGIQYKPQTSDIAIQAKKYNTSKTSSVSCDISEEEDNDEDNDVDNIDCDPDWSPELEESANEIEDNLHSDFNNIDDDLHKQQKFIVFKSCLKSLLDFCPMCCRREMSHSSRTVGTMLHVTSMCCCGYVRVWNSQPMLTSMPAGNLILAAGILFSGSSPVKAINNLSHCNISVFSLRTYNLVQSLYLVPSVSSLWQFHQSCLLEQYKESANPVKLGGDARCCSPGHTAKYGSYTLMDVQSSKVVDIQLVQSNEVANSQGMELEGLKRGLEVLKDSGVIVSDLITDRHVQVKKYMKDKQQDVNHWFDVWHIAKGVYKKLQQKAKKKNMQVIGLWARSVSNHLYWCAASSGGDGELVQQKWTSVVNHVANVHEGHGEKFARCEHETLEDRIWIKKDSAAHREMEDVVCSRYLLTDIKKLSPGEQTSTLESFHKIVCHFAPKSGHFFYETMKARLYLAALHFNANSDRPQAKTKTGELQFSVSFPKGRKGDAIVKPVKVKQNFEFTGIYGQVGANQNQGSSYRRPEGGIKRPLQGSDDGFDEDQNQAPVAAVGGAFRTAKEQLGIDNQKKYGGNRGGGVTTSSYGAVKKSLGTRRGPSSRFVPPVRNKGDEDDEDVCINAVQKSIFGKNSRNSGASGSGDKNEEPQDERLKGIEPKMIELVMNEVMDHGPHVGWDDIAGLEFAKKTIKEIVVWPMLRPDIFTGLRGPPKGLLLFGPPGTGKTLIGKCIASQSKSTFFSISASSLTSKWVGEGEKMVRALFAVARCHQPAVVFIDEIDSLLSQRSDGEHEASRRIKTEFLVQLDGAATVSEDRLLVIGATNRPQEIDEAARRRFVKRLYIPLPETAARKQIVLNLLSQQVYQLSDTELDIMCQKTAGYSGADMANLCREAALGPIRCMPFGDIENITADQVRPIEFNDFEDAFLQVRASVSEKDLNLYIEWNNMFGSTSAAR